MLSAGLLQDLKAKKPEALAGIVREHASHLLRAAYGLGLRESDAEELVQQTMVAFLEALDRFEGRSSVRTFLFGILYRKALEEWRKKTREMATDPADQIFEGRFNASGHWSRPPRGPHDEADAQETAGLIGHCLEQLVPLQRAAFHLKEVEHELSDSICNILGMTDTHLRVTLFRARNFLRECLEKKWQAQP